MELYLGYSLSVYSPNKLLNGIFSELPSNTVLLGTPLGMALGVCRATAQPSRVVNHLVPIKTLVFSLVPA